MIGETRRIGARGKIGQGPAREFAARGDRPIKVRPIDGELDLENREIPTGRQIRIFGLQLRKPDLVLELGGGG